MTRVLKSMPTVVMMALTATSLSGCGGKGTTKLSYTTPAAPMGVTLSVDKDGSWTVGAGLLTPVGTFAIEHTFEGRDEFTYIVMRNRERGTDQVFKIGTTGHVEVHAIGEHKFRISREKNRVIMDTQTISGSVSFKVYPSDSAIARVDFGKDKPDAVITSNNKMLLEFPSMWTSTKQVPLDSVKSIELGKRLFGTRFMYIEWRDGIQAEPMTVELGSEDSTEANFQTLRAAIAQTSNHITWKSGTYWLGTVGWLLFFGIIALGAIVSGK